MNKRELERSLIYANKMILDLCGRRFLYAKSELKDTQLIEKLSIIGFLTLFTNHFFGFTTRRLNSFLFSTLNQFTLGVLCGCISSILTPNFNSLFLWWITCMIIAFLILFLFVKSIYHLLNKINASEQTQERVFLECWRQLLRTKIKDDFESVVIYKENLPSWCRICLLNNSSERDDLLKIKEYTLILKDDIDFIRNKLNNIIINDVTSIVLSYMSNDIILSDQEVVDRLLKHM